jgi:hypothetical protein
MQSPAHVPSLTVSPASLVAACSAVPEPGRAASVRYPSPATLAMTAAAILTNHSSVLAGAEWGPDQDAAILTALGFPTDRTPCQSTPRRLFVKLDGTTLAAVVQRVALTLTPAAIGPAHDRPVREGLVPSRSSTVPTFLANGCNGRVHSAC